MPGSLNHVPYKIHCTHPNADQKGNFSQAHRPIKRCIIAFSPSISIHVTSQSQYYHWTHLTRLECR